MTPPASGTFPLGRVLAAALTWAFALAVFLVSTAPMWGLATTFGFLQAIALRGILGTASLLGFAVALPWYLTRRARARRTRSEAHPAPYPARLLVFTLALLVGATVNLSAVWNRGLDVGALASTERIGQIPEKPGEITIIAFNTLWENANPGDLARLITAASADVVLLPETSAHFAAKLAKLLPSEMQVIPGRVDDRRLTSMLISHDVGEYEDRGAPMPGARLATSRTGPSILAAHPAPPPVPYPLSVLFPVGDRPLREWLWEVRGAAGNCTQADIMGGDFNATLDHGVLEPICGYVNAAVVTGAGGWGTWPAAWPALWGAPIDHVYVNPAKWRPVHTWLVEIPGSDHRAVVARIAPN